MKRFRQRAFLKPLYLFSLACLLSTTSAQPVAATHTNTETWEMLITGDTEGKLKMVLARMQTDQDIYSITGKFSGDVNDYMGGFGQCNFEFSGKITSGNITAEFEGFCITSEWDVTPKGYFKGTISSIKGSGTWKMEHDMGFSEGNWNMKRAVASEIVLEEKRKRLKEELRKTELEIQESRKQKAENERLAHVTEKATAPKIQKVKLRSRPIELWDSDFEEMFKTYNFYVKNKNDEGHFSNDFTDNGDGTITDKITGLMWEKNGSESGMSYTNAMIYLENLNSDRVAGYDDWRFPTMEELLSLLEQRKNDEALHINAVFGGGVKTCWSSDTIVGRTIGTSGVRHYYVNFSNAKCGDSLVEGAPILSGKYIPIYVKAVRSIK